METSQVPVTISEEARARLAFLGMQREVARMIEHMQQNAPRLVRIEVDTWPQPPRSSTGIWVIVRSIQEPPETIDPEDFRKSAYGMWASQNFSAVVCSEIIMIETFLYYPPKAA